MAHRLSEIKKKEDFMVPDVAYQTTEMLFAYRLSKDFFYIYIYIPYELFFISFCFVWFCHKNNAIVVARERCEICGSSATTFIMVPRIFHLNGFFKKIFTIHLNEKGRNSYKNNSMVIHIHIFFCTHIRSIYL